MNEGLNCYPNPTLATPKRGFRVAVQGFVRHFRRAWRWAFVRRLAIKPDGDEGGRTRPLRAPQRMMYQWQRMPAEWRWF